MKTLDEVIAYFDNQTQQRHVYLTEDAEDIYNDALQYLKRYKKLADDSEAFAEWHENPPLSWDELKTMEGKPVWVDAESLPVGASPYWKDWYIIKSFSKDEFIYCNDGFKIDECQEANPPLTWDELQKMKGKPVWVEFLRDGESYDAEWIIIQDINDECMGDTQRFAYQKLDYSKLWQAYRKERHE